MLITGVKVAILEALASGFGAINSQSTPNNFSIDLTPNSSTIDYPLEEVQWPAIFVQFRPTKTQWTGLNPDVYVTISGTNTLTSSREIYFEGSVDFQVLAMHSAERDRLLDTIHNLIMFDPTSPASAAFFGSLNASTLVGITFNNAFTIPVGDTVSPGTPYSAEELTYEGTIRTQCVGVSYETKYNTTVGAIESIVVSGSITVEI